MSRKTSKRKQPAIIEATFKRDAAALRTAVATGDVNETDQDGRTALHHAAIDGDESVVSILLAGGADPNATDSARRTPLHFAAAGQHAAAARCLLGAGATVDPEDEHGNTPLSNATFSSHGRGEMICLLRAHGADIHHANRYGVSPKSLAETIANYDVNQWFQ